MHKEDSKIGLLNPNFLDDSFDFDMTGSFVMAVFYKLDAADQGT